MIGRFNPCFSGMAFGTRSNSRLTAWAMKFQSLFFWNGLWDHLLPPKSFVTCLVSILVFLEWPLGPARGHAARAQGAEFQSLFFWNGLWDDLNSMDPSRQNVFQSLFFWNGLWDNLADNYYSMTLKGFQSLFFWNGLWDQAHGAEYKTPKEGFNPCFSGMAFGTPDRTK